MLHSVNKNDHFTAIRILEFCEPNSAWHRSLWTLGIVITIREILEASEAVRAGVLHESSVKNLAISCQQLAGKDPAITVEAKHLLNECLRTCPRFEGLQYHLLSQVAAQVESQYVKRWADCFRQNSDQLNPERSARSIASHLLDLGFSASYLYTWWKKRIYEGEEKMALAELLELVESELVQQPPKPFEVLVALQNSPRSNSGYPESWLRQRKISKWLKRNSFSVRGVRPSCGRLLEILARDPDSASEQAAEVLDQLMARARVGTGEIVHPLPQIWVRGVATPYRLERRPRGVRVRALYREDQIYSLPKNSIVDAAIDLLSHLEASSPSAAIAGGWAAIEALLSEPNDRGAAAERLAYLVACSYPRAELTTLSYVCEKASSDLAAELAKCENNRQRSGVMIRAIIGGKHFSSFRQSDRAALVRIQNLLMSPSKCLEDIKNHARFALMRLYRQRNLVLHGGKTDSLTLRGSLRTAAKLVGAGMDRIAHGWYVQRVKPMELAARAKVSVATVSSHEPEACLDLLEVR